MILYVRFQCCRSGGRSHPDSEAAHQALELKGPHMPLRTGPFPAVALTVAGLLLTGCAGDPGDTAPAAANRSTREAAKSGPNARSGAEGQLVRAQVIPALGPGTSAKITAANKQAVVVVGDDPDSNKSVATLYERDPVLGWKPVSEPWPAHNALLGWTEDHHTADHRSPIGVFGLTDAGGMLPNPGTKLPYDEGPAFDAPGTGFEGEPLGGPSTMSLPSTTTASRGTPRWTGPGRWAWRRAAVSGSTSITAGPHRAVSRCRGPG